MQEPQRGLLSWAAGALHDCGCVLEGHAPGWAALTLTALGMLRKRSTKTGKEARGQSWGRLHIRLCCVADLWVLGWLQWEQGDSSPVARQEHSLASPFVCHLVYSEKYRCAFLMCGHFPHPRLEKCSQNNPLSLWLLLGAFLAFLLSVIYIHSCQALVVDQTGWSKGASIKPRVQGMIPSEGIWEVRFLFHEIAPVLRSSGADWARQ